MTESNPVLPVEPGDYIHLIDDGLTIVQGGNQGGFTGEIGDEVLITTELIAASWDGAGRSWLELVADPAKQIEKWGRVHVGVGRCPESVSARATYPRKRK